MMEIKAIGKYGRYCPFGEATNCYLVKTTNGKNILIDLGSGSLSLLQKHIKITEIDMVIITHLHFDHVGDLGVLDYALAYLGCKKIPVYMPSSPKETFEIFAKSSFDVKVLNEDIEFCVDNISFKFAKSPHPVETYSVIMTEGDKKVVYTSDCSDAQVVRNNTIGADIVIGDSCILEEQHKITSPHLSVRALAGSVPSSCKLYLAHLTAGDEDKILSEGKKYHKDTSLVTDFEI